MRTALAEQRDESETGVIYTEKQLSIINKIQTILQTEPLEDEYTDEREQDQELTTALMRFCMAVIIQDISKITVYDSPLMHFLAVMGVDTETKALRLSFYYTPILAGVLYINRLIMLEVTMPAKAWPMLKSRDKIQSVLERINKIRKKHLCEGLFSLTSSILSQLAIGKSFNKLHKSAPNIYQSEDEQTIFQARESVALQKVLVMCQELNRELREILDKLMFRPMLAINLSQIVDSIAQSNKFRRDNYSFIQHPKNKSVINTGYQVLLRRARKASREWQIIKKGVNRQDK